MVVCEQIKIVWEWVHVLRYTEAFFEGNVFSAFQLNNWHVLRALLILKSQKAIVLVFQMAASSVRGQSIYAHDRCQQTFQPFTTNGNVVDVGDFWTLHTDPECLAICDTK